MRSRVIAAALGFAMLLSGIQETAATAISPVSASTTSSDAAPSIAHTTGKAHDASALAMHSGQDPSKQLRMFVEVARFIGVTQAALSRQLQRGANVREVLRRHNMSEPALETFLHQRLILRLEYFVKRDEMSPSRRDEILSEFHKGFGNALDERGKPIPVSVSKNAVHATFSDWIAGILSRHTLTRPNGLGSWTRWVI